MSERYRVVIKGVSTEEVDNQNLAFSIASMHPHAKVQKFVNDEWVDFKNGGFYG